MTQQQDTPRTDAFQRAAARLEEAGGEAWKPIKNPKECPARIVISVSRVEERTVNTTQGPAVAIVVTGTEQDGRVWDVWAWHTVLHREMVAAAPQPGDVVAVEYRGKVTPAGGGNAYESYKVVRADDQPGGTFDWGGVQPPADSDPLATRVVYEKEQEQPLEEPELEPAAPPAPEVDDIPF